MAARLKTLVGAYVGEEVQTDVEECEKAEHAAEADELGELEEFSQRRDRQSENEEAEGPEAGGVLEKFNGVGAEPAGQRATI